jgi:signal peptidase II
MNLLKNTGSLIWLVLSLLVVILDQYTKYLVSSHIPYETAGIQVTSFFNLVYVFNEGAAFSFLASMGGWQRWFFMGIALVITLVLLIVLRRTPRCRPWTCLGISLVIGGAVGNLLDRIFLGHVIDFLLFYLKGDGWFWSYPAFNVADIAVCCGAGLLVIIGIFGKGNAKNPEKAENPKNPEKAGNAK